MNIQKVRTALNGIGEKAKSIDQLAQEITREHRIMFGALAEIKAVMPAHLGEGDDYLSQLLTFRRKADEILNRAWENLGLS